MRFESGLVTQMLSRLKNEHKKFSAINFESLFTCVCFESLLVLQTSIETESRITSKLKRKHAMMKLLTGQKKIKGEWSLKESPTPCLVSTFPLLFLPKERTFSCWMAHKERKSAKELEEEMVRAT
jgi:hypothetical protein